MSGVGIGNLLDAVVGTFFALIVPGCAAAILICWTVRHINGRGS